MAIRIIVRTDNASMAANVGGAVESRFETFDIEADELEKYLRADLNQCSHRQVIGVELVEDVK